MCASHRLRMAATNNGSAPTALFPTLRAITYAGVVIPALFEVLFFLAALGRSEEEDGNVSRKLEHVDGWELTLRISGPLENLLLSESGGSVPSYNSLFPKKKLGETP